MPEFRKYVYDKNGKVVEKEVNRIVREIYETKDMYIDIFGKTYVEQTENYDDTCVGAVNRDVVALLTLPVNIDSSTCVNFTKDYGFGVTSSGEDHKGIDFNEVTTKTKVNDPVYSIADGGKVLESSTDNTWSGTCKGGCLKIEYTPSANVEDNYKFTIIYEGMDHNSVTLTKDSTVNKGTQIGIIGSAAESEDGKMSSLHFAYLDNSTNSYIDPTNIIIPCSDHYEGDSNSAKVVNAITSSGLPDQFKNKIQLAALLGNLQQESSMTFDKMQKSTDNHENPPRCTSSSGSDGHALGIVQWDGRRNGLLDYAADKGSKWYNPDIQLNYLIGELTEGGIAEYHTTFQFGTKSHLYYNLFINATTVEAATKAFSKGFERCGNCRDEKRIEYANQYYQMLQSGNLSDIGGTTTSSSSSTTSSVGLKSCSTNSGNSSNYGVSSGNERIESYIKWMIDVANDDSHGYNQSKRGFNPDVDCSSFVYYALVNNNIISNTGSAFATSNMGSVLKNNGFTELPYSESNLQRGDIVVLPGQHTEVYIGNGQAVAAHADYSSGSPKYSGSSIVAGDQNGKEVNVESLSKMNWRFIYRLK